MDGCLPQKSLLARMVNDHNSDIGANDNHINSSRNVETQTDTFRGRFVYQFQICQKKVGKRIWRRFLDLLDWHLTNVYLLFRAVSKYFPSSISILIEVS